jgi:hypothetical protein
MKRSNEQEQTLNDGSKRSTASLRSTAALRGSVQKHFERVEGFERKRSD